MTEAEFDKSRHDKEKGWIRSYFEKTQRLLGQGANARHAHPDSLKSKIHSIPQTKAGRRGTNLFKIGKNCREIFNRVTILLA